MTNDSSSTRHGSKSFFDAATLTKLLITLAVAVNFSGLFLIILGPDGTLYASIAKTMVLKNNYIEMFGNGADWLDKPHFPFWITALSFKIFGIHDWSYRLPAILFLLLGVVYTWKFAYRIYQDKMIANWSVLILLSAEHIILSNTDVRAEPYLTTTIIAAVYHFQKAYTLKNNWQLIAGSLFTAFAIMTKGIFAVIPIGAAIGGHLLLTKNWKDLFNVRWLIAGILIFLFIMPELYSVYYQFDLHPEKIVFGKTGVSGLKFFFWDSQFGRFFNTGPIKGKGDPSFFLHTTLWAFLPWSIILYVSIYQRIKNAIKKIPPLEWYTICGSLATFLVFSLSRFQLPHYLNIVFPFFAILTAQYIRELTNLSWVRVTQYIILVLLILGVIGLHFYFKPGIENVPVMLLMLFVLLLLVFLPRLFHVSEKEIVIGRSVLVMVFVNFYLNGFFYPRLLTYQGGTTAAVFANQQFQDYPVVQLQPRYNYPLEFYLDAELKTIPAIDDTVNIKKPYLLILQNEDDSLHRIPVQSFSNFPISKINIKFLNPGKRKDQLKKLNMYLVK
jgi:4-amino-4-deoxy-L-arabinose transferase-like glycosyltransferase